MLDDLAESTLQICDELRCLGGGRRTLFGESSYFLSHDREPSSVFACPRRFDAGVERKQIGEISQFPYRGDELHDFLAHLFQLCHLARTLCYEPFQVDQLLDGVTDGFPALAGHLARCRADGSRFCPFGNDFGRRSRELFRMRKPGCDFEILLR